MKENSVVIIENNKIFFTTDLSSEFKKTTLHGDKKYFVHFCSKFFFNQAKQYSVC